jgi:hypothetical protein
VKAIVTILLVLLSGLCKAQDTTFVLVKKIPIVAADLAVDNLNQLYILTTTGQVKKYNANGDSVAIYNEVKKYGQLNTMDVTNPLSILLFYRDFSTVVLLDRFLSQRSTIELRKMDLSEVSAVGLSNDNNVWLFDAIENKLKKIDEKGNLLHETSDFRSIFSETVVPQRIIDQNGKVYLYDPKAGIYVFDYYGSFQQKIPLKNLKNFSISGNRIAAIDGDSLLIYDTGNFMQKQYQFPSSFGSFTNYIIGNTRLFGLSADAISIYSFRF